MMKYIHVLSGYFYRYREVIMVEEESEEQKQMKLSLLQNKATLGDETN